MLEVSDYSGKLYQVLVQFDLLLFFLSLLLVFFSLTLSLKGECQQDKQSHQNTYERPVSPEKHAAKIDKKTAETEPLHLLRTIICEILTVTSAMIIQKTLTLSPHPRGFHLITLNTIVDLP